MEISQRQWCDDQTRIHISEVRYRLLQVMQVLSQRAQNHDASKLEEPEASGFAKVVPQLKSVTYGSDEYNALLKELNEELNEALDHHYAHNRHHPEYHADGIRGMNLLDLLEMLCDWRAAGERHDGGDIHRSLAVNTRRFGIDDQLYDVLWNTVVDLGWTMQKEGLANEG